MQEIRGHEPIPDSDICVSFPLGTLDGHLFQSLFASVAMGELHLLAAVFYVSLNPVRAGLAAHAADWAWSSVRAHLAGKDDGLAAVRPVLLRRLAPGR